HWSLALPLYWMIYNLDLPDKRHIYRVPVGKTVKFHCQATGKPLPALRWYKNGKEVRMDQRIRDHTWTLIKESVAPSDEGNYTCVVQNRHGTLQHTYQLNVIERSPQKPDLHAGLQGNRIAVVGSDVELVCAVMGDPQPYIRWFKHIVINGSKEDIEIFPFVRPPKDEDLNAMDYEVESLLTLRNVTLADAGEYTCLASNSEGVSRHTVWLISPFWECLGLSGLRYQFSVGLYSGDHSPIAVLLQREQCGHVIQADLFCKN
uniref:receptor protein-tyrosine kinase n=1 Tax=Pundamilia nyererei TaxID=303518 RepID=A0A3B4G2B7_9CICH